jgi:predicted ABC-type ATPase
MAPRRGKPRRAHKKKIIVIAGPNGAGKTTFAEEFLTREANCPDFINADLIARGLSPFAPEKAAVQAGRIMLAEIARRVARKQSFAFETTLSGRNYARHIPRWRKAGYDVKLIFLSLPSAELAIERVASRVARGGHNVPDHVVGRRFDAGLHNFHHIYCHLVDQWVLYDNAGDVPLLLDRGGRT